MDMNKALNASLGMIQTARVVPWLLPVYALLVAVGTLSSISDSLMVAITPTAPPGQLLYVLSKVAGLLAMVLVWLQLMLSLSGRILRQLAYSGSRVHRISGLVLLLLLSLHAALFVAAVSVRHGSLSLSVLVPNFTSGFYTSSVSLGVLGLLLFGLASAVYMFRQNRERLFRWGHRCVIAACLLVFVHSYLIGSETRSALMGAFYLASLTMLLAASAVLFLKPIVRRRVQYDG